MLRPEMIVLNNMMIELKREQFRLDPESPNYHKNRENLLEAHSHLGSVITMLNEIDSRT